MVLVWGYREGSVCSKGRLKQSGGRLETRGWKHCLCFFRNLPPRLEGYTVNERGQEKGMTKIPNNLPVKFHWKSDLVSMELRLGEGWAGQRRLEMSFRFFILVPV